VSGNGKIPGGNSPGEGKNKDRGGKPVLEKMRE
jgi:hypothetical protein